MIAHFLPLPMGGLVFLTDRLYLFGQDAAAVAARAQPAMDRRAVCAGRWVPFVRRPAGTVIALMQRSTQAAAIPTAVTLAILMHSRRCRAR